MSAIIFSKLNNCDQKTSVSRPSSCIGNRVYASHKAMYQEVSVIKPLNIAKFPVYLVSSKVNNQKYAMKVFDRENDHSQLYFKNETRFACLQHPNVVRNLYFEEERKAEFDGKKLEVSYTIMEYAQHGDFLDFLRLHREAVDEKLARTYFRQLIEGLEYIHKNGVAHMDLKLDNLLLGTDCNLKIADFDMAYFENDALIIGHGTKFYRAPELAKGRCHDPKTADIFSAGIVLFSLKTQGVFPQFEDISIEDIDFADLMYNNTNKFWNKHTHTQKKDASFFSQEFKDLFISMTKLNPDDRASIETIKASKWYNGPVYTPKELVAKVGRLF